MKRMNEKRNYTIHEYYYVHGLLYSRLKSKQVSLDSRLVTVAHKFQNETKAKPRKIFAQFVSSLFSGEVLTGKG